MKIDISHKIVDNSQVLQLCHWCKGRDSIIRFAKEHLLCFLTTFVPRYLKGLAIKSYLKRELTLFSWSWKAMIFRINQCS